jgi:ABC-2 type transport system ATP-binding protein
VWLRQFLRQLAGQGRTILVSSHVLSEVEQTVDSVVIINNGTLRWQGKLAEHQEQAVVVRTPDPDRLKFAMEGEAQLEELPGGLWRITGKSLEEVGRIAFFQRVELHELTAEKNSLEQIFFALTGESGGAVEHFGEVEGGAA